MSPTEVRYGLRKRRLMLAKDRVLNECRVILLRDRNEHSYDISDQVSTAFGHAVQEYRFTQWGLNEFFAQLIQVIPLDDDSWHRLSPQMNVPA